jgi:hypothetical protein
MLTPGGRLATAQRVEQLHNSRAGAVTTPAHVATCPAQWLQFAHSRRYGAFRTFSFVDGRLISLEATILVELAEGKRLVSNIL